MKIQRMKLIWAAAMLLAAGCSQEQATDSEAYSDVRIELRSSIVGGKVVGLPGEVTRAAADGNQPMTLYFLRANETEADTDIYYPYSNTVLSAIRPGGGGVQPLTFEYDLFYLVSGAKSKLTGWYPEATSFTSGVASWTLDGTQEVLTAAAREGSKTTPIQPFEFKQTLSQLRFRFQAKDAGTQAYWGRITRISLLRQPSVCLYNPGTNDYTGKVTFDPTGPIADFNAVNIYPGNVPTTPTVMSDPMKIVPQKNAALTLMFQGSTGQTGRVSIVSTTYEPGKSYTIDFFLEEAKVTTGGASIAGDWIVDSTPRPPVSPMPMDDLSKDGIANCYVVTSNIIKNYFFDATKRGNGYEKADDPNVSGISYSTLPNLATATEARVLWQTGTSATTGLVVNPASVMLKGGKVRFSLGDAIEGNAVIGLFASSDPTAPCLWSWHIWRVNGALPADVACVKTPSPTSAPANFKMMALNLGAFNNTPSSVKSIGLLYQWGRKDPFPGAKDFTLTEPTNIYGSISNGGTAVHLAGNYTLPTIESTYNIGTEAWAVQYPGVFITESGDWMDTQNEYLWGTPWKDGGVTIGSDTYSNNQGVKSIYDPCPVGYRVPPEDTWNQAVKGTWTNGQALTGIASSGSFYFPASGYRLRASGSLYLVGRVGCSWSSASRGSGYTYGSGLYMGSTWVYPLDGNSRGNGFPVRCVQDL